MKKKPHLKRIKRKSIPNTSTQKITIDMSLKKVTLPDGTTMVVKDRLDLEMFKHRLDFDMGNSFAGVEAFIQACEENAYPPLWAIDWIFHAFRNYKQHLILRTHQSKDKPKKKPLDEFFGLSSKKRLTDGEKACLEDKNFQLFNGVSSLIALGAAPKEAFLKISNIAKDHGLSHTPRTIKKIYLRFRSLYPTRIEDLRKETLKWTDAEKQEFLSCYLSSR
jgi:hypothetical protein